MQSLSRQFLPVLLLATATALGENTTRQPTTSQTPRPTPTQSGGFGNSGSSSNSFNNTNNKSSSTDKKSKDKDSKDKSKGAKTPPPARGSGGKQPVAKPSRGSAPRRGGGGSGSSLGQFKFFVDPNVMSLRLAPAGAWESLDTSVEEGTTFQTDLLLTNEGKFPLKHLHVVMSYNPAFVKPTKINDERLKPLFGDKVPVAKADDSKGTLTYDVDLREPAASLPIPIFTIHWHAEQPTTFTEIRLSTPGGATDVLNEKGKSILGDPEDPEDGSVGLGLSVLSTAQTLAASSEDDAILYMGTTERVGGVRLKIESPETSPAVGDKVTLPVILDNSAYSQIDGLNLLIEFDSDTLEILDSDYDNYITHGPNILDGLFHAQFPWDYQIANTVYQQRGLIEYRVGTSRPDQILGRKGPLVNIVARALKATPSTALRFRFVKRAGSPTTSVTYLGEDVLGDPKIAGDGTEGAAFAIKN